MATLDDHGSLESDDGLPSVMVEAPLLVDGQQLDQPTFHELYCQMPEDFRAELIDGVVHVMSMSVFEDHSRPNASLMGFLYVYQTETPGTIAHDNGSAILGPRSEVQPDCSLRINPAFGGQTTRSARGCTVGCPELVVEVSLSSLSIDLNAKKRVYQEAGAREYLVFDVPHQKIHWFALLDGKFEPLEADPDGLYRSLAFPGLWLDADAFVREDGRTLLATLRRGLESQAHADFVDRLRQNRTN